MRARYLGLIAGFVILPGCVALAAGPSCDVPPLDSQAKILLYPSGYKKLALWGAQQGLDAAKTSTSSLDLGTQVISPVQWQCTPARLKAMPSATAFQDCFGLPKSFSDPQGAAAAPLADLEKPEPSSISLSGLSLTRLELGSPRLGQCAPSSSCLISIPLQDVAVRGNVSVNDLATRKKIFSASGISAEIGGPRSKPVVIQFSAKLDASGKIESLIQLGQAKTLASIPPGEIRIGLALTSAQLAEMRLVAAAALYDGLVARHVSVPAVQTQGKSPAQVRQEKAKVVLNLSSAIAQSDAYHDAAADAFVQAIQPRFDSKQSAELFQSADWAYGALDSNPAFAKLLSGAISKALLPQLTKQVNATLGKLPLIHSDIQKSVPIGRLQDSIDLGVIGKSVAQQQGELDKLASAIRSAATSQDLAQVRTDLKADLAQTVQLLKTVGRLADPGSAQTLLQQLLSAWQGVSQAIADRNPAPGDPLLVLDSQVEDQALGPLSASFQQAQASTPVAQDFALRVVAADVNRFSQTVTLGLGLCTRCGNTDVPIPGAPAPGNFLPPPPASKSQYDVGIQISLDTLDQYLTAMYETRDAHGHSMWDLCVDGKPTTGKDCDRLHFQNSAPQLQWDGKSLVLHIPNISYNGLLAAGGDVRVNLAAASDGKHLTIDPVGLDAGWRMNHANFWTTIASAFEAMTLVVPLAETAALHVFKGTILNAMGTPEVSLPPAIDLKNVQAGPKSLTFYGNLTDDQGNSTLPNL